MKLELDGICNNGYAVTYSIAREIIRRANEDGYMVGDNDVCFSRARIYKMRGCAGVSGQTTETREGLPRQIARVQSMRIEEYDVQHGNRIVGCLH